MQRIWKLEDSSDSANLNRYWDHVHQKQAVKILPGGCYVSSEGELVVTTLGSCVAACIRDVRRRIGGMNHFMLPMGKESKTRSWEGSAATRYGDYAMEALINGILKRGGRKEDLEIKLFGGARVLRQITDVGEKNISFVREFVQIERLKVVAEDVGGLHPRKIYYFPDAGRVLVKKLRSLHDNVIAEQDLNYLRRLRDKPVEGDIELFD